jgi:DNA-binding MarR family transcriptional regulator
MSALSTDRRQTDPDPTAPATGRDHVRWLDELEMAAWLGYIETQGDLMAALETDLASTGLTLGDYQVFVYLSGADDQSMRMCDLADALQLSPSGLTRRLDGLVRDGLVSRQPSQDDRRVMLAVLTDAGRRRLDEAAPVHVDSVRRRIIDRLTRAELETLAGICAKVRSGLDECEPPVE